MNIGVCSISIKIYCMCVPWIRQAILVFFLILINLGSKNDNRINDPKCFALCTLPEFFQFTIILCMILSRSSSSISSSTSSSPPKITVLFWNSVSSLILEASQKNILSMGWGYSATPNAQRGGPACPFLTCLSRKALPAATLPPAENSELCDKANPTTTSKYEYF